MRAAMLEAPRTMAIRNVSDPVPEAGGVILKVGACAICGTDVRIYNHGHKRITLPAIIGHEIAGTVVAIGANVTTYAPGDLVALSPPGWSCGVCRNCRRGQENLCGDRQALSYEYPGGFAEYVAVPAPLVTNGSLHPIAESTDLAHAAITEPLACCINGQQQVHWRPDDRVLIIGGGPIGIMHSELVRARGAESVAIIDVAEPRLSMIRQNLPDVVAIDGRENAVERIRDWSNGDGPDVVIVCTSSASAYSLAFETAGRCGQVLLFAGLPKDGSVLQVDMNAIHYRQLAWYGSFGSMPQQGAEALRLLTSGKVNPARIVTHRFPLAEIGAAMETAQSLSGLKIVIQPGD